MLFVGLSGGIGSGKSTASQRLVELGAELIDADLLAREVVEPGTPALAAIVDRFGASVLDAEGALDRPALGATVFSDDQARADLNAIVHPAVAAATLERVARAREDAVLVHDIPLLVELGREVDYQLTVIIAADAQVRLDRLVRDRGMDPEQAKARMAAQASDEQRRAAADVWLPNEGTPQELTQQVDRLWTERLVPYRDNLASGTPVRRGDRVVLSEPDPAWESTGDRLARRIAHHLRSGVGKQVAGVEHIGSTSVPGLAAKDVIDLQVRVASLEIAGSPAFVDALRAAGFVDAGPATDDVHPWAPDPADWRKRLFAGADPGRVAHVHVRADGSPGAQAAVAFRDWLRSDATARSEYAALKARLAAEHPGGPGEDRGAYPAAKQPWFAEHLPQALRLHTGT
ncbi:dephospho-CoA kinase [Dermacoccaceae bacterium W4C1]